MYAENSDVICVNETWLNQSISNSEKLHSGFTIFRRDRSDRGGGGVLIAVKAASFKAVKKFKPESEAELQQLEIIFVKITTLTGQRVLIAIKTTSFKAVKEFKPESEAELQQLEIIFVKISTLTGQRIYSVFAIGHPMKTQVGWMYSIIFCMTFVTSSTIW